VADPFCTRILVPVDFSPCSGEAFRIALTLARTFQAELLLLHRHKCTDGFQSAWAVGCAIRRASAEAATAASRPLEYAAVA
jgi:nucleotide-binding universal stress UspA family protein